jgi:hypothetical protein
MAPVPIAKEDCRKTTRALTRTSAGSLLQFRDDMTDERSNQRSVLLTVPRDQASCMPIALPVELA